MLNCKIILIFFIAILFFYYCISWWFRSRYVLNVFNSNIILNIKNCKNVILCYRSGFNHKFIVSFLINFRIKCLFTEYDIWFFTIGNLRCNWLILSHLIVAVFKFTYRNLFIRLIKDNLNICACFTVNNLCFKQSWIICIDCCCKEFIHLISLCTCVNIQRILNNRKFIWFFWILSINRFYAYAVVCDDTVCITVKWRYVKIWSSA